jgi:NodT family efflux transporter outer membrane factor (OMF) lipoprotein
MFQPEARPSLPLTLPETYALYTADTPGPGQWWKSFDSAELNSLVEEALSGNFDILTAWSRLKQADAVARRAGASLKPSLSYSAGAEKSWRRTKSDNTDAQSSDTQTYSAGVGASYEIDLWGRLNALKQSETLEVKAAREDLDAAAVTVSAEVVATWVDILSVRRQIAILQEQIKINKNLLNLQQLRFSNGKADALDVAQQYEMTAAANAKLPLLQLTEQQQRNTLAMLLGRSSAQGLSIRQENLPDLIPVPGTGLPADLLAARPDVRAAGLRLTAADWRVSAARANRLPSITLSADAAYSSNAVDLLFNNWVTSLAAGLTGPLFDAGSRSAEVDRTRAVAEAYLADYARTVAEAIQEVEDGLATENRQGEYIALLKVQMGASRAALKNAHIQYINGKNNYLNYLTAWTTVQNLERQLVEERATLIKIRVGLCRAVGGDWTRELVSGAALKKQDQSETTSTASEDES